MKQSVATVGPFQKIPEHMKKRSYVICLEKDQLNFYSSLLLDHIQPVNITGLSANLEEALSILNRSKVEFIIVNYEFLHPEEGLKLFNQIRESTIPAIIFSNSNWNTVGHEECPEIMIYSKPRTLKEFHKTILATVLQLEVLDLPGIDNHQLSSTKQVQRKFIAIKHLNTIQLLNKEEVVHLSSNGRYTCFYLSNKEVVVSSKNLGEYEKELFHDGDFIRVHHSHIVNLNYLSKIDKENGWNCIMSDKSILKISRRRREDIYERLNLKVSV